MLVSFVVSLMFAVGNLSPGPALFLAYIAPTVLASIAVGCASALLWLLWTAFGRHSFHIKPT
jgi:hypothetical protein